MQPSSPTTTTISNSQNENNRPPSVITAKSIRVLKQNDLGSILKSSKPSRPARRDSEERLEHDLISFSSPPPLLPTKSRSNNNHHNFRSIECIINSDHGPNHEEEEEEEEGEDNYHHKLVLDQISSIGSTNHESNSTNSDQIVTNIRSRIRNLSSNSSLSSSTHSTPKKTKNVNDFYGQTRLNTILLSSPSSSRSSRPTSSTSTVSNTKRQKPSNPILIPRPVTPPKPRSWDDENGFETFEVEDMNLDLEVTITCDNHQDSNQSSSSPSSSDGDDVFSAQNQSKMDKRTRKDRSKAQNSQKSHGHHQNHHHHHQKNSTHPHPHHTISLGHVELVMNDLEASKLLYSSKKKLRVRYSVDEVGNRSFAESDTSQEDLENDDYQLGGGGEGEGGGESHLDLNDEDPPPPLSLFNKKPQEESRASPERPRNDGSERPNDQGGSPPTRPPQQTLPQISPQGLSNRSNQIFTRKSPSLLRRTPPAEAHQENSENSHQLDPHNSISSRIFNRDSPLSRPVEEPRTNSRSDLNYSEDERRSLFRPNSVGILDGGNNHIKSFQTGYQRMTDQERHPQSDTHLFERAEDDEDREDEEEDEEEKNYDRQRKRETRSNPKVTESIEEAFEGSDSEREREEDGKDDDDYEEDRDEESKGVQDDRFSPEIYEERLRIGEGSENIGDFREANHEEQVEEEEEEVEDGFIKITNKDIIGESNENNDDSYWEDSITEASSKRTGKGDWKRRMNKQLNSYGSEEEEEGMDDDEVDGREPEIGGETERMTFENEGDYEREKFKDERERGEGDERDEEQEEEEEEGEGEEFDGEAREDDWRTVESFRPRRLSYFPDDHENFDRRPNLDHVRNSSIGNVEEKEGDQEHDGDEEEEEEEENVNETIIVENPQEAMQKIHQSRMIGPIITSTPLVDHQKSIPKPFQMNNPKNTSQRTIKPLKGMLDKTFEEINLAQQSSSSAPLVGISSSDPKEAAKVAAMLKVHFGFIPKGFKLQKNQKSIDPKSLELEMENSIRIEEESIRNSFINHQNRSTTNSSVLSNSALFPVGHSPIKNSANNNHNHQDSNPNLLKSVLLKGRTNLNQNNPSGSTSSTKEIVTDDDEGEGEEEEEDYSENPINSEPNKTLTRSKVLEVEVEGNSKVLLSPSLKISANGSKADHQKLSLLSTNTKRVNFDTSGNSFFESLSSLNSIISSNSSCYSTDNESNSRKDQSDNHDEGSEVEDRRKDDKGLKTRGRTDPVKTQDGGENRRRKSLKEELREIGYEVKFESWSRIEWKILEGCYKKFKVLRRKNSGSKKRVTGNDGGGEGDGEEERNGEDCEDEDEDEEFNDFDAEEVVLKFLKILKVDSNDCKLEWEWSKLIHRVIALDRRRKRSEKVLNSNHSSTPKNQQKDSEEGKVDDDDDDDDDDEGECEDDSNKMPPRAPPRSEKFEKDRQDSIIDYFDRKRPRTKHHLTKHPNINTNNNSNNNNNGNNGIRNNEFLNRSFCKNRIWKMIEKFEDRIEEFERIGKIGEIEIGRKVNKGDGRELSRRKRRLREEEEEEGEEGENDDDYDDDERGSGDGNEMKRSGSRGLKRGRRLRGGKGRAF